MTRYSVERAMAESTRPSAPEPVSRWLWLESPSVDAKALLVEAVAQANNCRAIQSSTWGFVALVGHAAELDVVELLVTSLLVQSTRAMTLAGPRRRRAPARRAPARSGNRLPGLGADSPGSGCRGCGWR